MDTDHNFEHEQADSEYNEVLTKYVNDNIKNLASEYESEIEPECRQEFRHIELWKKDKEMEEDFEEWVKEQFKQSYA